MESNELSPDLNISSQNREHQPHIFQMYKWYKEEKNQTIQWRFHDVSVVFFDSVPLDGNLSLSLRSRRKLLLRSVSVDFESLDILFNFRCDCEILLNETEPLSFSRSAETFSFGFVSEVLLTRSDSTEDVGDVTVDVVVGVCCWVEEEDDDEFDSFNFLSWSIVWQDVDCGVEEDATTEGEYLTTMIGSDCPDSNFATKCVSWNTTQRFIWFEKSTKVRIWRIWKFIRLWVLRLRKWSMEFESQFLCVPFVNVLRIVFECSQCQKRIGQRNSQYHMMLW